MGIGVIQTACKRLLKVMQAFFEIPIHNTFFAIRRAILLHHGIGPPPIHVRGQISRATMRY